MAGNYMTLNSVYQPISLQEMLIPLQHLQQEHDKAELEYYNTEGLAGAMLGNLQPGSETHKIVSDYLTRLQAGADSLAQNGVDANTMRELLKLKAQYASTITPIETAYKRYMADREALVKMQAQDPYIIPRISSDDMSVDAYYKDKELINEYVSGTVLHKKFAESLKSFSQANLSGIIAKYNSTPIRHLYDRVVQNGYQAHDLEQLYSALGKEGNDILSKIANDVVMGTKVKDWGQDNIERAYQAIRPGLTSALGTQKSDPIWDQGALALDKALNASNKSNKPGKGPDDVDSLRIVTMAAKGTLKEDVLENLLNLRNDLLGEGVTTDNYSSKMLKNRGITLATLESLVKGSEAITKITKDLFRGIVGKSLDFDITDDNGNIMDKDEMYKAFLEYNKAKDTPEKKNAFDEYYNEVMSRLQEFGVDLDDTKTSIDLQDALMRTTLNGGNQKLNLYSINANVSPGFIERLMSTVPPASIKEVLGVRQGKIEEGNPISFDNDKSAGENLKDSELMIYPEDPSKFIVGYNGKIYSVPNNRESANSPLAANYKEYIKQSKKAKREVLKAYAKNFTKSPNETTKEFYERVHKNLMENNPQYKQDYQYYELIEAANTAEFLKQAVGSPLQDQALYQHNKDKTE